MNSTLVDPSSIPPQAAINIALRHIDNSVESLAKAFKIQLHCGNAESRQRLQLATMLHRYVEFLDFSKELNTRLAAAPKNTNSAQVVHILRDLTARSKHRASLNALARHLALAGYLRPQPVGASFFEHLLEDARDVRKGLALKIYVFQLYGAIRSCLIESAEQLEMRAIMLGHINEFDVLAHQRTNLVHALITECQDVTCVNELLGPLDNATRAIRSLFCVPAVTTPNLREQVPVASAPMHHAGIAAYA